MGLKDEIRKLAQAFDDEDNAASDLWSWLPSHEAAGACHGDYAYEFRPSVADVMREAAAYMAFLKGYDKANNPPEHDLFECPCGECEGPSSCADCDLFVDKSMRCRAVDGVPFCDGGKPHGKCPFIRGNGGLPRK